MNSEAFWARAIPLPSGCLEYPFSVGTEGYGRVYFHDRDGSRMIGAHRFAFFLTHGRFPPAGKLVCHTRDCTTKLCVLPAHLYEGDARSNDADWRAVRTARQPPR